MLDAGMSKVESLDVTSCGTQSAVSCVRSTLNNRSSSKRRRNSVAVDGDFAACVFAAAVPAWRLHGGPPVSPTHVRSQAGAG